MSSGDAVGKHRTLLNRQSSVSRVTSPAEAWPICSTMAAMVETPDWAALDPDFAAGKRAIGAGDWEKARKVLTNAALRDTRNADIQNYLGYAYRRLRQFDPAIQHYQQAPSRIGRPLQTGPVIFRTSSRAASKRNQHLV